MSFQNLSYFAFLPLTALLYLKAVPRRWQNGTLVAASLVFYWLNRPTGSSWSGFWPVLPLVLLLTCSAFLWKLGMSIQNADPHKKKALVTGGICLLLGVLALFKYFNLLLPALPFSPGVLHPLPFPLGISFYCFAAISYLVDVSRGDMPAEQSFLRLTAFLSFFGTITAGPICRARSLLPQLAEEHHFDRDRTVRALRLFMLGLFKKVAVADVLMMYVSPIFSDITGHGGPALVTASVFYTLFLYFDFLGYSEMARASALLLGIEIPENFKTPFFSTNFSGFWSRWHISLSSWLQDYLFTPLVWFDASRLPLPGKKINRFSPVFCVFIVFFVSGFWHGSTLPFVIWGLLQGLYRASEEILHQKIGKPKRKAAGYILWAKRAGVFTLWNIGMVFFAMGSNVGAAAGQNRSLRDAFSILAGFFQNWSPSRFVSESRQAVLEGFYAQNMMAAAWFLFLAVSLLIAFWLDTQRNFKFKNKDEERVLAAQKPVLRWILYYALVLLSFVGLVMQNGGFAGGSFAYGGF